MNESDIDTAAVGGDKIIRLDEAQLREHLDRKITQSVEETLNKLLDLPPYSPGMNPIETVLTKTKAYLKEISSESFEMIGQRIAESLESFFEYIEG